MYLPDISNQRKDRDRSIIPYTSSSQHCENSNGVINLVSFSVLKQLGESIERKLRSEITLLDNKATFGKIPVEKSTAPKLLNYDEDSAYTKLKSALDSRTEFLKQQFILHSKLRKDNPEKEFIGIVEVTGELVVIVSRKEQDR